MGKRDKKTSELLKQRRGMQCPECGTRQKNDITPQCRCGYRFIFQKKTARGMTDAKFRDLLRRAGDDGIFQFTFPQLYTAWCQQDAEEKYLLLQKKLAAAGGALLLLFTGCFFFLGRLGGFLSLIFLVIPWLILRQYRQQSPPDLGGLKKLLKQWQTGDGGGDEMLLVPPSLHTPPADFPEQDVFDYGVEKIIIVERPLLVDLLVKNGFHADQNALIFSRDGYPDYIVQQARNLLKQNSSLPIYFLHDAGETGMARKKNLAGRKVIDLGINPEHLERMSFLNALQLHRKGYKAPLDILPYPVLAALFGEALREKRTVGEVLEQRDAESATTPFSIPFIPPFRGRTTKHER